jgi:hypothetical protein
VPNVLDAAIGIFMHYIRFGEHLFSQSPWTYTRCQEEIFGDQMFVGGLSPAGLYVHYDHIDCIIIGVAALRKFF